MNKVRRLLNTVDVGMRAYIERRVPFWPEERIDRLQQCRLRSIICHAYQTVPFYRRAMDERGLRPSDFQTAADLEKLPLIDSLTVRKHVQEFISSHYGEGSRQALRTSGTQSHVSKVIYWDHTSLLRTVAYAERNRDVLNALVGREWRQGRVSIVGSESALAQISAFWKSQLLIPRRLGQAHLLSAELPFDVVAQRINDLKPAVVTSYGSYTDRFFRFLADSQLAIVMPRVWVYVADALSPGGQDLVEREFGCHVYSYYGSVETGRIGFQCERRRGFHLNVDLCAVRLIDEEGRTLKPGAAGEVVISNLHNRAMVLLNYRLGDLGVFTSSPCTCGRSLPVLGHLEGRCTEMLQLSDGRIIAPTGLEVLCKQELRSTLQSQIVQLAPGKIRWRIVPFSGVDRDALCRRLLEKTRAVVGEQVEVTVEFVENIPSTPQGKFLRIISAKAGSENEREGAP